ncbi:MAG: RNA polymerase-associated protein RapA [Gammaproteobacteria bacterium]|nr:RNA polymerase-associated protein RapA [Gammaproteobacteria bacterium]
MPRIFDNIEQQLLPALREAITVSDRADFCAGYFNLRGWKALDSYVERWSGAEGSRCRLLVGMQRLPQEILQSAMRIQAPEAPDAIDQATALRHKKRLAEEFKAQLTFGVPTSEDEAALRRLAAQLRAGKVVVKLFLRHPLHAKLYLLFRSDPVNPIIGYLGSSNLTFAGLSQQGELNVDVLDHDACQKLAQWFDDRWNDRFCWDISEELAQIIRESWAREEATPPYYIYVKMAYHLSQEARAGLSEFRIPKDFRQKLFDFQSAAVKIAAHHLHKRGGVIIGDVVGLGKTLMATALARIFEDDFGWETLIICPKNLVPMWEDYRVRYRLHAKVLSLSQVIRELPKLRRYRLVLIDESHNLRNREGSRYRAIREYIEENESRCILLSATPYNKTYTDLSNQLRLFVPEGADLGIRPERLLRELGGETEFMSRHNRPVRSLGAFEISEYADDWRELMRLYLVRRTRSFIQQHYAETDAGSGRKFLRLEDGSRSYFPTRLPKTVKFKIDERNLDDQYARLYADDVVDAINDLKLPRYGLGNYVAATPHKPPTQAEARQLQDLSRAGKRLMGFCRTNLFKRLESSGHAFTQSVTRHILRNYVFLYAIENNLPLPIGTQSAEMLDARVFDEDAEAANVTGDLFDGDENGETQAVDENALRTQSDYERRAEAVYAEYSTQFKKRFKWLPSALFIKSLAKDLLEDSRSLLDVLEKCGEWDAGRDAKLTALVNLLTKKHAQDKVLVFTQFADTARYLGAQFKARKLKGVATVTGDSPDPTELARRFSPASNDKRDTISPEDELRALVATDVLSEGQNLQDCAVIVNYDLPWAIIRLIQRAGRVDRIGQKSEQILCYSFLPADGVERIIRLRARVRQRLQQNAEVVGADEAFFEDDRDNQSALDLYHEKAGILDGDADTEVDLASYAYQIWKNAITEKPELQKLIPDLPAVVYSTRAHQATDREPEGALVYLRTAAGNDALAWVDAEGRSVTESQFAILRAAECSPDAAPLPRRADHHELVQKAVTLIAEEEKSVGGQLGRPSGARFRAYERLKRYAEEVKGSLFESQDLLKAIDEIYRYPLHESAVDALNRQLRSGISDQVLAQLVIALRSDDRLCRIHEDEQEGGPRIICSLGLSVELSAS